MFDFKIGCLGRMLNYLICVIVRIYGKLVYYLWRL